VFNPFIRPEDCHYANAAIPSSAATTHGATPRKIPPCRTRAGAIVAASVFNLGGGPHLGFGEAVMSPEEMRAFREGKFATWATFLAASSKHPPTKLPIDK
jgi:hypothetical protein